MRVENISKITSIIGLVFEALGMLAAIGFGIFLFNMPSFFEEIIRAENLPASQEDFLFTMLQIISIVLIVLGSILIIVFFVNLYLFTRMIAGKLNESTLRKVLVYQAIWGGISLAFNQLVGILYLISGLSGLNKFEKKENVREGL